MQFKERHITLLIVQVEPSCNMLSAGTGHEWPTSREPDVGTMSAYAGQAVGMAPLSL